MVKYCVAQNKHLDQIAEIHIKCFPDYFITSLGKELIKRYYYEFLKEDNPFIIAIDNNNVIGFCMGYIIGHTNARNIFLKKNRITLSLRLARQCVRLNRQTISKCLSVLTNNIRFDNKTTAKKKGGDLLSICVLEKYRGKGISKELVNQFEKHLVKMKQNEYWLGVYKTNSSAIRFYKKLGMNIEMEDREEYKFHKKLTR